MANFLFIIITKNDAKNDHTTLCAQNINIVLDSMVSTIVRICMTIVEKENLHFEFLQLLHLSSNYVLFKMNNRVMPAYLTLVLGGVVSLEFNQDREDLMKVENVTQHF